MNKKPKTNASFKGLSLALVKEKLEVLSTLVVSSKKTEGKILRPDDEKDLIDVPEDTKKESSNGKT